MTETHEPMPRPGRCDASTSAHQARANRQDLRLLRFLGINMAIGTGAGWAFLAALLWFDIGGLGTLVLAASDKYLAIAMMMIAIMITWGSLAMGTALFIIPKDPRNVAGGPRRKFVIPAFGPASGRSLRRATVRVRH